jgi:hypothetical protein
MPGNAAPRSVTRALLDALRSILLHPEVADALGSLTRAHR